MRLGDAARAAFVCLVSVGVGACGDAFGPTPPGPDQPPTLEDLEVTTAEDTPVSATIAASDDEDAVTLAIEAPRHGALTQDGATFTYTPEPDFHGEEQLRVTATAGDHTTEAVLRIVVTPVNDAPVAADDARAAVEDVVQVILPDTLLANDADVDGDALEVVAVDQAVGGAVALDGTEVVFHPTPDFSGDASFRYTVSDGALTDTATATLAFAGDNDAPVATDDTAATDEDTPLELPAATPLANDADPEGQTLSIAAVGDAVNGTVALARSTVTFTPAPDFHGTASFTYTVTDGALTDTATVTVTVAPVDDAPVAVDDASATMEDVPLVLAAATLLSNDTDVDGGNLTVTAVDGAANGTVELDGTTVTFTPAADFHGAASFDYTVSDGAGGTDVGRVTVTVSAVNDAPVAVDDIATTAEDSDLVVDAATLLANDTDADGDTLTAIGVSGAVNGTVALAGTTITFTPDPGFFGTAGFDYTISDGAGGSDIGHVVVTVTEVNVAPVASDDAAITNEGTPLNLLASFLLANDTDPDGDILTLTAVGDAVSGTVTLVGSTITFTPDPGYHAAAGFTYTVSDGALTDSASVSVTINRLPIAMDDAVIASQDTPVVIPAAQLLANDADADGDPLTVTLVDDPTDGTVSLAGTDITFTPNPGFVGDAFFTYTVSDGAGGSANSIVTVTVTARLEIAAGYHHTCAILPTGAVKCWGNNAYGQLGLGDTVRRGDQPGEMGAALPAVDLGTDGSAVALSAGGGHTCALLDNGAVKCWGGNNTGQLGLGDTTYRGDEPGEMGDALPAVDLGTGRSAVALSGRGGHTCALLDNGAVKCWGRNDDGQLGLGDTALRGDHPDEMGDALPAVDLGTGRFAVALSAGGGHTCALLDDATVKCWGRNDYGQLGVGNTAHRGDHPGEMGDALPAVDLGTGRSAVAITVGSYHTCALLDDATVKCWGLNFSGRLGLGDLAHRGDQPSEMGDSLPAVNLGTGRSAVVIAAAGSHTCALLDNATVKCWGDNYDGQLGLGDTASRGYQSGEMGDALPAVALDASRSAVAVSAGEYHTCAVLDDGAVKCWGGNNTGQLGLGDTAIRGDGPGEMGDALPVVQLE